MHYASPKLSVKPLQMIKSLISWDFQQNLLVLWKVALVAAFHQLFDK